MRDTSMLALAPRCYQEAPLDPVAFYRHVLETLNEGGFQFLVGGAFAFNCHSGVTRQTRDLDLFIRRADFESVAGALEQTGYEVELKFPHWLGKVSCGALYIDVIFSSGNGVAQVDDEWFAYAGNAQVLDIPVKISPVEEMIWSKAFIMEKERFDGADIVHLIRSRGPELDWRRLLRRFDKHWRVLLAHLTLFGFVYPGHRDLVPLWVMDELLTRLLRDTHTPPTENGTCFGTLLSREQYLMDIEQWGCRDARLPPLGNMSPEEAAIWTRAIRERDEGH